MRKIVVLCLVMSSMKIHSQSAIMRILDSDPRISTTLRQNNVYDPNKSNNSILGNPYSSENYMTGKISSLNTNINFRYNAYKDVIEFKDGNNIYELPKDVIYSPIELGNGSKVVLINNSDGSLSYYTELYSNNGISLLKKQKVNLLEAKPTNGYREATAPKFSSLKTDFFLKDGNNIFEFPKNKKELLLKYPNSFALQEYVKKNSTFIKDENDLKQITRIISEM